MPQMAPLSWLILFIVFSSTLILFSIMNYFLTAPTPPQSTSSQFETQAFNWKW
uniref:ATP synthase complex subunit 8 n=3 Tax=Epeorus TaxID=185820 RepID=A0A126CZ57_9INSE|nr:ATP synthase F0 subunit 8 [Epeorus carinatus]AHY86319.1 ATP synthase F0 subunit 8 [Epeorus sp. JZ-2014]QRM91377.1 ATP synthase F0 subunit 8 [Epeorus carinatus]QXT45724.1 ATP synthase F0 subunit 8 [Epeorus dayongensis]